MCIFIPEVRMYWKSTDKKLGTFSCVGLTVITLPLAISVTGVLGARLKSLLLLNVILGFAIMIIGYALDMSD